MATSEDYLTVGEGGDSVTWLQLSSLRLTLTCLLCMVVLYNLFNSFYNFHNHSQMTKYNTIRHIRFYSLSKTLNHARVRVGVIHRLCRSIRVIRHDLNGKWVADKFMINAQLKILMQLMLNRVKRRVNAINPAALVFIGSIILYK